MRRETLQKIKSSLLLMLCLLSTAAFAQSTMIPIGGSGTATSQYSPIRAYYGYNYSQTIYVADSLLANGATGAGFIDKIRYQPASTTSWANVTAWTIYMANTTNTNFATSSSWVPVSSLTQVFSGSAPTSVTSGTWVEFTLSSPFFWDGTSNLLIAVDENTPSYTASEFYFSSFTSTPATGTRTILYYSDVTNPDPLSPPAANYTGSGIAKIQLEWTVATACSGVPNVPAASGPASVCPNAPLALSSSGFSMGTGISYQWQFFNTGTSTWDPVTNATATNVTIPTGQAAATDYRLVTTCVNGGGTSVSNTVSVAMNSFVNCYCTSGASNAFDGEITNVTVGPLNNSSTCAASNQMYTDFTTTVPAATLMQASVYPVSVMAGSCGGSYSAYVKIYIDFDHDGMFTGVGEEVYAGVPPGGNYTPAGVAATGTLSIPATALTGNTRMRVILNQTTTASAVTPCGTYNYGETEDYLVNIVVAQNCSGTPSAVTASGPATVCANNSITLTSSGYSSGLGISYAWQQFNTATSTWDPIAGANNPFVTISGGQTASTDYRMVTTCSNGGGQDFSNTVTVGMSPFTACYCSPLNGTTLHTSTSNYITNVAIPTTTLNHATPSLGTGGYTYADPTTPSNTASLTQGVPYTINATHSSTSTSINTEVWFDWDQSGTFDASEYYVLTGSAGSSTTTVTPPTTALPGNTGMRIRAVFSATIKFGAAGACANISQGRETQDYIITVVQAVPCAGTPSAVTASGPASACSGSGFTLNAAGFSTGLGISYEWQSFNTATSTWDPIAGSNTPSYTVAAGQTVATDYRFVTTCSNGGGQDFSNTVTVAMSSFYLCYCSPMTGTTLHSTAINYITNVTIASTTLNNSSTTVGPGGYTQYFPTTGSTTTSLNQGIQYTINVTHPYTGYYGGAWIDWDQNGTMDPAEFISMTTTGLVSSGTFIIPYSSTPGLTGLRVRMNFNPITSGQPCTNQGYETEDYVVTIVQAVGCSGIPNSATVTGPANACAATPFTLTATGYSIGTGISYQWEFFNTATSTWDPMPGTNTNPTYSVANQTAATDYRFTTVCSNGGGTSVSNTLSVGQNPPTQCYCTPIYTTACTVGDDIDDVIFTGDVAPGINNLNTPCPAGGYQDFTAMSATVSPGLTYSGNVTTNYGSASEDVRIWVDYNLNGVFEATESVATISSISNASTGAFSFTIPAATAIGSYRMRVRLVYNTTASTIDPCISYTYGEAHDYMLNVSAPPTCLPPTSPSVVAGTGTTGSATWTPSTSGPANGYEWRVFPQGSGPNGTPVTSGLTTTAVTSASISGLSPTLSYTFYVRAHCSATDSSNWVSTSFTTPCATVTGPYTYDVESHTGSTTVMSNCWTSTPSGNATVYAWNVSTTGTTPSTGTGPTSAHSGTKFFFVEASYGAVPNTAELISPVIDITSLGTAQLEFWYHMFGTTMGNLETSIWNGSTWTVVDLLTGQQQPTQASPWLQKTIPLQGYTGAIQIRFKAIHGGTFTGDIAIDDISVVQAPACLPPAGLSATNVTPTSADVSWTAATGAVNYEYAVDQTNTAAPGASSTVSTTTSITPATVTGLSGGNTYYLHVRTNCGTTNGFSAWAVYSFGTPPPNDPCLNAINISNQLSTPGVTTGATQSMPACDATVVANDVWYMFSTGNTGGTITVNVNTTVGDIVMETFTGTCGSFTGVVPTTSSNSTTTSCIDQVATGLDFGTYAAAPNTTYYVRVYGYNSAQSTFTIQATGTPLAITLGEISAVNAGSRNRVDWNTLSEEAGDYFELERSANGSDFTRLGQINSQGRASIYSYWDESPVSGLNYYRLKMLDANGSFHYSKVVSARVKGEGSFTVEAYPNPVSDVLTVTVYGTAGNNPTLSISDVTGKVVKVVSVVNNGATIDMGGLAQGMYLVKYTDNNHTQTIKVNKK